MPSNEKPAWYVEKRRQIEEIFASAEPGETAVHSSPTGAFRLEVTGFSRGENRWAYSRGRVFRSSDNALIGQIDRNYRHFPFSWCERHPSGHAYLVCGEDYQGQTVIELDTGRRHDQVDEGAGRGAGFCWVAHYPSPDGRYVFVDGCYWACPYELILFDFSDPMSFPYRELGRWPVWKVSGYQPDGTFGFEYAVEVRRSDGKPISDLSEEEEEELGRSPRYEDVVKEQRYRVVWRPDGSTQTVSVD